MRRLIAGAQALLGKTQINPTVTHAGFPAIPPEITNKNMNTEMHEMTNDELGMTHGGMWPLFFAGVAATAVGALVAGIVDNWEDFKKGVSEGYNTFA
jgi:lactobin A/cerein 7B family class IIb bacteriocin